MPFSSPATVSSAIGAVAQYLGFDHPNQAASNNPGHGVELQEVVVHTPGATGPTTSSAPTANSAAHTLASNVAEFSQALQSAFHSPQFTEQFPNFSPEKHQEVQNILQKMPQGAKLSQLIFSETHFPKIIQLHQLKAINLEHSATSFADHLPNGNRGPGVLVVLGSFWHDLHQETSSCSPKRLTNPLFNPCELKLELANTPGQAVTLNANFQVDELITPKTAFRLLKQAGLAPELGPNPGSAAKPSLLEIMLIGEHEHPTNLIWLTSFLEEADQAGDLTITVGRSNIPLWVYLEQHFNSQQLEGIRKHFKILPADIQTAFENKNKDETIRIITTILQLNDKHTFKQIISTINLHPYTLKPVEWQQLACATATHLQKHCLQAISECWVTTKITQEFLLALLKSQYTNNTRRPFKQLIFLRDFLTEFKVTIDSSYLGQKSNYLQEKKPFS